MDSIKEHQERRFNIPKELFDKESIEVPRDHNGDFDPIVVSKHESRGLSIERFVISLYAKGMSVSDIEDELRDIYK